MSKRPHILITNDDGINAIGIKHLWQALRQHAHLTVVAPAHEQSAMGLSTTIRQPLRIEQVGWEHEDPNIWSVNGTPVDCVKLGLGAILTNPPDLIVSGINRGSNLGRNVLYSGTVAAAIESIMHDIPAIAFSCQDYYNPDYAMAGKYIPTIVDHVFEHPLPKGTLLNVNFPERSAGKIKGFKMTQQGKEWWGEKPDKRTHPAEGHEYYWIGAKLMIEEESDGDGYWARQGYITAVPVHIADLTDHRWLAEMSTKFESLFPG